MDLPKPRRFTDANGRKWLIEINGAILRRAQTELGINLFRIFSDDFKEGLRILDEPATLVSLICLACEDQIEEEGLSEIDFARTLSGEVIFNAAETLMEAIIDFFPPAGRAKYRQIIKLSKEVANATGEIDLKLMEMAEAHLIQMRLSGASSRSPESSASTTATIPTGKWWSWSGLKGLMRGIARPFYPH